MEDVLSDTARRYVVRRTGSNVQHIPAKSLGLVSLLFQRLGQLLTAQKSIQPCTVCSTCPATRSATDPQEMAITVDMDILVDQGSRHAADMGLRSDPSCPLPARFPYVPSLTQLTTVTYIFIQVLVVMPILMPLHILYSPDTIAKTSMIRASVSSLVETSQGRWLWVHTILIWWSSILWLFTALWIIWGGIGYRKREVERLRERHAAQGKSDEEVEGAKQFRTLMVLNIPPDSKSTPYAALTTVRDEEVLREYFDHNLQRHRARTTRSMITMTGAMKEVNKAFIRPALMLARNNNSREVFSRVGSAIGLSDRRDSADLRSGNGTPLTPVSRPAEDAEQSAQQVEGRKSMCDDDDEDGDVDEVILVRKLGSLISLRERRSKVLKDLELVRGVEGLAHSRLMSLLLVAS